MLSDLDHLAAPRAAPDCHFIGASTDRRRFDLTPRMATRAFCDHEASLAAVREQPKMAALHATIRDHLQQHARWAGLIAGPEYAVPIVGQCLAGLPENDYIVADPSLPVQSGQICLIRVDGVDLTMGKVFLGRLAAVENAAEVFARDPGGVLVFWASAPPALVGVAVRDVLAADACVGRIEDAKWLRHPLPEALSRNERAILAGTLAQLDRSPLMIEGSAFAMEQAELRRLAGAE